MKMPRAALLLVASLGMGAAGARAQDMAAQDPGPAADEVAGPVIRLPGAEAATPSEPAALRAMEEKLGQLEQTLAGLRADAEAQRGSARESRTAIDGLAKTLAELRAELARLPSADQVAGAARSDEQIRLLQKTVDRVEEILGYVSAQQTSPGLADDHPRLAMIFAAMAAVLAFGAIVAVVWLRPGRAAAGPAAPQELREFEARVRADLADLTSAVQPGSSRMAPLEQAASALAQAVGSLQAETEALGRQRASVDEALARLGATASQLEPAALALEERVRDIGSARSALASDRAEFEREKQALADAAAARDRADAMARDAAATAASQLKDTEARLAEYDRLLPDTFSGGGALAAWKSPIMSAAAAGRPEAVNLLAALLRWQQARTNPGREREQWLEATEAVGRACHAFLAAEPAADQAKAIERLQAWTRAFKTPLEEAFPSLKLNAAYPGDRFDTDRMEAVGSISGGRQSVNHSLSWFVLEKVGDATRVLRRAQVVTA